MTKAGKNLYIKDATDTDKAFAADIIVYGRFEFRN